MIAKLVPRAPIDAIVVLAVRYTFNAYAVTVHWGSNHLSCYAACASPFISLAEHYAGSWLADLLGTVVAMGLLAQ